MSESDPCPAPQRLLVYLGRAEMPPLSAGEEDHIDGCPACREEHDSLHAFVAGERLV